MKRHIFVAAIALAVGIAIAAPLAAEEAASLPYEVTYGEAYAERPSGPLKADLFVPRGDGPFPGVVVIHGGAWRMGTRAQLAGIAKILAAHGYVAAAISYRLAPEHKFPAQIEDCREAVRWLRRTAAKWRIDPARVGALGYSAGAHLAALLGAADGDADVLPHAIDCPSCRVQCVVAGGTPSDFRTLPPEERFLEFWLGGSRAEKPDLYRDASPRAFVTADDPPMFLYHGGNDQMVPLISAEALHRSLDAAGVDNELYVIPDVGHMAASYDRSAIDRAVAFLDRRLKPAAEPQPTP